MEERLQKILSRAGISSRRAAEKLILEGHVKVDDKIINKLGTKFDVDKCKIFVDNRLLKFNTPKIYILINKPRKILSSVKDDRGRITVIDLIKDVNERIYPVGRLDFDSEGLLLLTNDGDLTNALLHPKFKIEKTYIAKITGNITDDKLDKLRKGIQLDDGITAPAIVHLIDKSLKSTIEITIYEGRNRQVRRMFSAIGCDVKRLKRIKFANLEIGDLQTGQYRRLTKSELSKIYKLTGLK